METFGKIQSFIKCSNYSFKAFKNLRIVMRDNVSCQSNIGDDLQLKLCECRDQVGSDFMGGFIETEYGLVLEAKVEFGCSRRGNQMNNDRWR